MSLDKSVSKRLHVHDPSQPQVPGRGTDVKIEVRNHRCLLLTKLDDGQYHDYRLTMAEPLSLGLSKLDDRHGNEFMRCVVMACNLIMNRAAFSTGSSDSSHVEIDMGNPPPATVKLEPTSTGMSVTIHEFVLPIRDSVSVVVGYVAVLDEALALDALEKILVVSNADSTSLEIHNLKKSLDRYLSSTQSTNEYRTFEGMYESLEHATNFDKPNRTDDDFDTEVRRIMGDDTLPIKDLRRLNNRIKHPDTEDKRVVFDASKDKMTEKIRALRPIAAGVILHRLKHVTSTCLSQAGPEDATGSGHSVAPSTQLRNQEDGRRSTR